MRAEAARAEAARAGAVRADAVRTGAVPVAALLALGIGAVLVGQALAAPLADAWRQERLAAALADGGAVVVDGAVLPPALRVEVPARGIDCTAVAAATAVERDELLSIAPVAWRPFAGGPACVAAHRDAHFRHLADVRPGDRVRVRRADGVGRPAVVAQYRVSARRVVAPDDATAVAGLGSEALVLLTCWPPDAVGPAPLRLLVVAEPERAQSPTISKH